MKLTIFKLFAALLVFCSVLNCQYVGFGRNKVQYNNFDWHTLSTEHFKIFYYPEMKELAEIGAAFAEESYRIHQQNFNYSLIDTVPLIFYSSPSHFRETNTVPGLIPDGVGGFFEFIKGRVVIPFDGSLGNFRHVIRHELCHVFMTAKVANILRLHKQSSERQLPLWFIEGLAEYWSTEWDATAEMVIKDAILNNYMEGLDDWERFYGTFFMYKMGQNALMYIGEKYGKEKILLLMENVWMSEDFSTVMQKTIGKDYEAFDKEWLYYLKKKYFSEFSKEDSPSSYSTPIYTGGFGHKPAYYKNGEKEEIYFIGNKTGYTSLFKINLKNRSKVITVIEGEKSEAFEEFHFFRAGLDISAGGTLAFATKSGASDALHLFDVKSEKLLTSFHFNNIVQIGSPSFSSNGEKIVFPALDMGGKSDLYIFEIKNKNLIRLTNDYYDDRDPDISPDNKSIVFSSDRTSFGYKNRYNLFIYDLENNSISYLTNGNQVDYSPQFSPEGKKIVYTSTQGSIQNIWMTDLSNGGTVEGKGESIQVKDRKVKKITNFTTAAFDPKWAGDNKIVYATYENGRISVRILNNAENLIDTPKTTRLVDFSNTDKIWTLQKIKGIPKKNQLRYKKEYSLDIATTNISADPVFGASAGGIIALSDLLGNDQYYFLIYNNSETGEEFFKSFNIAVSRLSLGQRLNYAYGIYHLSGTRYDFGDDFSYFERTFGGYFALSYPLSFFRRIDAGISLANSKRSLSGDKINRRALLLTNSIGYTKDNSIWGPTGPLDGNRFNLTLGYTTDLQFGNVNYYTLIFDYRRYFRISNTVALATRLEYLINEGKEARRWVIGGSWDLRGWPRFGIRGKKAFVASTELRFPLVDLVNIRFPLGINFIFPYIRGAAFVDVGNAWDKEYGETLGSIGLGARINLFYVLALRYDFGKRIENNFTTLQDGLFHQFFFGWDF
ncbi:MAG: BamA/TamA family outer membrane protein [Chlorobi bacterium]|nr:BamA/TamA family outer membrane protein [Chlorobiota bacterium]MCI0716823.1 BamA/TamA family outer membrane protein [Chlorobiota bacterium]